MLKLLVALACVVTLGMNAAHAQVTWRASPSTVDFGEVQAGETSASTVVSFQNVSAAPQTMTPTWYAGNSSRIGLYAFSGCASVAPGAACAVTFTIRPPLNAARGPFVHTLRPSTDSGPTAGIQMTGTVIDTVGSATQPTLRIIELDTPTRSEIRVAPGVKRTIRLAATNVGAGILVLPPIIGLSFGYSIENVLGVANPNSCNSAQLTSQQSCEFWVEVLAPMTIDTAQYNASFRLTIPHNGSNVTASPPSYDVYVEGRCNLDIDGSGGAPQPSTDGVLLLRYMLGFRDAALVNGLNLSGTRTTPVTIQSFMADRYFGITNYYGGGDALGDGLLLTRLMQGVADQSLGINVNPGDRLSNTASNIRTEVNRLCGTTF
jgi:hypothetical protein